jgi:hypothetical protein
MERGARPDERTELVTELRDLGYPLPKFRVEAPPIPEHVPDRQNQSPKQKYPSVQAPACLRDGSRASQRAAHT